ncbi:hypothetical protein CR513_29958, partial [Mucuna pruriens]
MLNSQIIGYGFLTDDLYKLFLAFDNIPSSLVVENSSAKRYNIEKKSFMLWQKHLCHIFKERIERLTKKNILPSLNFDDLVTYVNCIRGKFTKTKKERKKTQTKPSLTLGLPN